MLICNYAKIHSLVYLIVDVTKFQKIVVLGSWKLKYENDSFWPTSATVGCVRILSTGICQLRWCVRYEILYSPWTGPRISKFATDPSIEKRRRIRGGDFWEKHESLLTRAWSQVTRLHPELYVYNDIFQEKFINSDLRHAVQKLKEAANFSGKFVNELYIKTLISEAEGVKDVFYVGKSEAPRFGLFTKEFSDLFLKELDYLSNSGIPMRRPNGMNRYGAILGKFFDRCRILDI